MDERIGLVEGAYDARGLRFGIVAARFNDFIVDRLLSAAVETLIKHGVAADAIDAVRVPGAFEIPLALKQMAAQGRYDGLVALGCVIRGATPHFEYVAGAAANGVADVSLAHAIPIGFGVLTVESVEQAMERAGSKAGNKGADAALTAIEMVTLLRKLEKLREPES
jgi:6,7-dimethyl-8-ribityllumazine synthase